MNSEKIYRRLTENIQNKMAKYKEGKSTKDSLNDQLIINISSLCRFLRKREEEKVKEDIEREKRKVEKDKLQIELDKIHKLMLDQEKKERLTSKKTGEKPKKKGKNKLKLSEEMQKLKGQKNEIEKQMRKLEEEEQNDLNQTILDVFVPYSRLTKSLQLKLESLSNPIIEEENIDEKEMSLDGEAINLDNSLDHEKIANLIADEDAEDEAFDGDGDILMKNTNIEYLTNDDLSISMSLFNKPLGFDDFDNNDNNIAKNKSLKGKDSSRATKNNNELIINSSEKNSIRIEVNKEEELKLANEEFRNILNQKVIKEIVNDMSYDYMKYMYLLFQKMKKKSIENENETNQSKSLNFINQFKSFILDIGISDKKFYEQCIREIIYNKNELDFGEFLECFKKLINLKFDQTFLKFKFLFHITERENDEYFKKEELENYFNLLEKCKKICEPEIVVEIRNKLIPKYKKIFPGNDKIYTRKLSLVLEQFFDLK